MGAFSGIDYCKFTKQIFTDGMSVALSQPQFNIEIKGAKSADGERGLVWGTNVLAPYIMVRPYSFLQICQLLTLQTTRLVNYFLCFAALLPNFLLLLGWSTLLRARLRFQS